MEQSHSLEIIKRRLDIESVASAPTTVRSDIFQWS